MTPNQRSASEVPELGYRYGPRSRSGGGPKVTGHPVMFGKPQPANHFGHWPDGGGYPIGFLEWAFGLMRAEPDEVLHLCSGSVTSGLRLDARFSARPDVVADCRRTPFRDATFRWILADPPYAEDYARNLYGTGELYPRPGEILAEARRILHPDGVIGLLHFLVPVTLPGLTMVGVWGVTVGAGYSIRAFSLFRRHHDQESML